MNIADPAVRYATASDGYRIAYTAVGSGEAVVVLMPTPIGNLELDLESRSQRPFLEQLAARFRLIRYDGRGQGLSQRGLGEGLSLDDLLLDLEAVVDALGLQRFILFGRVVTSYVAVRYAVDHPERVAGLVLWNTPFEGLGSVGLAYEPVIRSHWDFAAMTMSHMAYPEDPTDWAVNAIRQSVDRRDFLRWVYAAAESPSISEIVLGLHAPTLVLDFRGRVRASQLAESIPNARLVTLASGPPVFPFGGEPLIGPIEAFVRDLGLTPPVAAGAEGLSRREIEVLRLVAQGKTNQQIADELVISPSTAAKHVASILAKTETANRAEATSYAHSAGLI